MLKRGLQQIITRVLSRLSGSSTAPLATDRQPSETELNLSNLYHSINDFPFNLFIRLDCDNDLSVLVKTGTATPVQLEAAKMSILDEYSIAIDPKQAKDYVNLAASIEVLSNQIDRIKILISACDDTYIQNAFYSIGWNEEAIRGIIVKMWQELIAPIANELREEGFEIATNEDFERAKNGLISLEHQLQVRLNKYNQKYQSEKEEADPQTKRETYYKLLTGIRNHVKWYMPDTITTREFCNQYASLVAYNKHMELQQQKTKSHGRG